MGSISRFCRAIERVVRATVLLGALLFPALIFVCVYEVIARYIFNASTIWAFDITFMLHGSLFMLTGAYGLQKRVHVRIDVFSDMMPVRLQHIVYALIFVFCFVPGVWLLTDAAVLRSWSAFKFNEVELMSAWGPLVWPFYTAMALGLVALILQSLVEIIRHCMGIFTGAPVAEPLSHEPDHGV